MKTLAEYINESYDGEYIIICKRNKEEQGAWWESDYKIVRVTYDHWSDLNKNIKKKLDELNKKESGAKWEWTSFSNSDRQILKSLLDDLKKKPRTSVNIK